MATKRQAQIPGTETKKIKELDAAAESYVEQRDKRMKLTDKEKEAKAALVTVMKKHGLTVYKDEDASPPLIVTLTAGDDKVKVTQADGDRDDEEGKAGD